MSADACTPTAAGLARRVVLITGGARRLGRAIALALADAGWDVAVHYRASPEEAQALCEQLRARGARAQAFHADLEDPARARALLAQAVHAMGAVDAVVNNASLFEHDAVDQLDADLAMRHHRVNVLAPVLLTQALHAHLSARGARGCVVNLLDQKLWNPNPDHLSYTLSKAALREATTLLAQGLAPVLRVVGVAPGLTLEGPGIDPARLAQLQRQGPLGHGPGAADVADAVRFCLTNPALTGTTILVDSGQHLQPRSRDFSFD